MMRARAALFATILAQAAHAGPPELVLPLDCTLGETCYIEDYVDADPGPGQSDYTCGLKSRDGHRGTDIVLRDFAAMERGVKVLAAAPGRVAAIRDGMTDVAVSAETTDTIEGRECGNGVRVDHGDGWQTLYCHMRQGSISVREGDHVASGAPLGLVGLSGLTNIPHVHLSVLKDGEIVDPFAPEDTHDCAAPDGDTLWADPPAYHRAGLFTAGFSDGVPEFEAVKSGAARATDITSNAPLVLYGHVFHAKPGDVLEFSATGPDGAVLTHSALLRDPQKQLFRAFGRNAPESGWPPGDYRGYVRLMRGQMLVAWRHADTTVTAR